MNCASSEFFAEPYDRNTRLKVLLTAPLDAVNLPFPSPGEKISAKFSQDYVKSSLYFAEKKIWDPLKLLRLRLPSESFCCPTHQPTHTPCGGQEEI